MPYYGEFRRMYLPPLATPAILSFLSLNRAIHGATRLPGTGPLTLTPVVAASSYGSLEWDGEWERCRSLGRPRLDSTPTRSFRLGSIEGMWEGIFTVNSESGTLLDKHAFYKIVSSTPSSTRTAPFSLVLHLVP